MTSNSAKALADEIRARDWNKVIAPTCFGERGLEVLQELIDAHGLDDVDEAVGDFLARSKANRAIRRGHVKSCRFFGPYINEQRGKENVACVE